MPRGRTRTARPSAGACGLGLVGCPGSLLGASVARCCAARLPCGVAGDLREQCAAQTRAAAPRRRRSRPARRLFRHPLSRDAPTPDAVDARSRKLSRHRATGRAVRGRPPVRRTPARSRCHPHLHPEAGQAVPHPRLDRSQRRSDECRDLALTVTPEIREGDCFPLRIGQSRERLGDALPFDPQFHFFGDAVMGDVRCHGSPPAHHDRYSPVRTARGPPPGDVRS